MVIPLSLLSSCIWRFAAKSSLLTETFRAFTLGKKEKKTKTGYECKWRLTRLRANGLRSASEYSGFWKIKTLGVLILLSFHCWHAYVVKANLNIQFIGTV